MMSEGNYDLFFVFLRLKSYLISIMDDPAESNESFEITNEYLLRKYPDEAEYIISLMTEKGIVSDGEIAFDPLVHVKFKEIVKEQSGGKDLPVILNSLQINMVDESTLFELEGMKKIRAFKLNYIIKILMQLIKTWSSHNELEKRVKDLSELSDESLIRPEETEKLEILGKKTEMSQRKIVMLTEKYLELMTDYYFNYGGNFHLHNFIDNMSGFEEKVIAKYRELINKHQSTPGNDET